MPRPGEPDDTIAAAFGFPKWLSFLGYPRREPRNQRRGPSREQAPGGVEYPSNWAMCGECVLTPGAPFA